MNLDDLLRKQHGVLDRAGARAAGLSNRQFDRMIKTGRWQWLHRGVYRHRAVPASREGALLGAVLATKGVASHRSAALNLGLGVVQDHGPEVSIPATRRSAKLERGYVYRTSQWEPSDHVDRQGIPTTGVERTIMDCAWRESPLVIERLAESAIRQRLTTWQQLDSYLVRHAGLGRNGGATFREMLESRSQVEVSRSDFSLRVAQLLVNAGLPRPELEYRICDYEGNHVLQVDLAWPNLNKAWECDGLQWHFERTQVEQDKRKRNRARALGWNIQEILWSMYQNEKQQLVTMARRFLALPNPLRPPSPRNLESSQPNR